MNGTPRAKITALGSFAPPRVLTNHDLEKMVDTSDEWILTRTGISQRHVVDPGMATSDMATEAARRCLEERGIGAGELDLIIVATISPDMFFPATACLVQHKLGATCWGFDLGAACSGFLYGLETAARFIGAGTHRRVLVIGADTASKFLDYTDRNTCILFGDGAGAVLVEPAEAGEAAGLIDSQHQIEGMGGCYLNMPAGGSLRPASAETVANRQHCIHLDGQQVFKYAVRKMSEVCAELLERNHLTAADVDCFIPHQANLRIIEATAERLGLDSSRVLANIGEFGNTVAATVPLGMQDARRRGLLKPGSLALLATAGAGFTAGAQLLRWA